MQPVPSSIAHEELMRYPVRHYDGPVVVINSDDAAETACARLRRERYLGFDTETKPSFRAGQVHPPALLQLAAQDAVYLFQLQSLRSLDRLADVLTDSSIIKAGVALEQDIAGLSRMLSVKPAGMLDLGVVAQRNGVKQLGLRSLTALFLGFRITKGPRTSNWERRELTPAQIRYAATDAWVSRLLYEEFAKRGWITLR